MKTNLPKIKVEPLNTDFLNEKYFEVLGIRHGQLILNDASSQKFIVNPHQIAIWKMEVVDTNRSLLDTPTVDKWATFYKGQKLQHVKLSDVSEKRFTIKYASDGFVLTEAGKMPQNRNTKLPGEPPIKYVIMDAEMSMACYIDIKDNDDQKRLNEFIKTPKSWSVFKSGQIMDCEVFGAFSYEIEPEVHFDEHGWFETQDRDSSPFYLSIARAKYINTNKKEGYESGWLIRNEE